MSESVNPGDRGTTAAWISAGLVLAGVPVVANLFAFVYEAAYCRVFGIPTVMVNKWSATDSLSPIPIARFVTLRFRFPGLSTICDSDGAVLDHRAAGEGIVLADVRLDPELRRRPAQPTGYWSRGPKHFARTGSALFRLLERLGTAAYARSEARRAAARAAATRASR